MDSTQLMLAQEYPMLLHRLKHVGFLLLRNMLDVPDVNSIYQFLQKHESTRPSKKQQNSPLKLNGFIPEETLDIVTEALHRQLSLLLGAEPGSVEFTPPTVTMLTDYCWGRVKRPGASSELHADLSFSNTTLPSSPTLKHRAECCLQTTLHVTTEEAVTAGTATACAVHFVPYLRILSTCILKRLLPLLKRAAQTTS
jgi:hypothetical protein